jgi:hypothetical protein
MSNPLDRLRGVKEQADSADDTRRAYQRFINHARTVLGWSDSDVSEYADSIKVLMNGSDEQVMDLFPAGLYKNASEARDAAVKYWISCTTKGE